MFDGGVAVVVVVKGSEEDASLVVAEGFHGGRFLGEGKAVTDVGQ